MSLKHLQNGSDIRGVASENEFQEPVTLTNEIVEDIARSFACWLRKKTNKNNLKISVGHDSRVQAHDLKESIITGLRKENVDVMDCGLSTTPAMFMTCIFAELMCDGAIMITASHLPWHRNGMKFFDKMGGLQSVDITNILEGASYEKEKQKDILGSVQTYDLIERYSSHLKDLICKQVNCQMDYYKPLKGLHIIVDAGNGAGGFYANKVLEPLGANVEGSLFLEPDGRFPNHIPNPEDKEAITSICQAVQLHRADLGIIFDTDVDRSSAVDAKGNPITRNAMIALIAAIVAKDYPNCGLVSDSVTSNHLQKFLEEHLKISYYRYRRGYKNVINKAISLNEKGANVQVAIETSGHGAMKENYFLDDGAYLATKIVIEQAKHKDCSIESLIALLKHPVEEEEFRIRIACESFSEYADQILKEFELWVKNNKGFDYVEENYEGVRFNIVMEDIQGWGLLRKSLHDPLLSLQIESDQHSGCQTVATILLEFFQPYTNLELDTLRIYLEKDKN